MSYYLFLDDERNPKDVNWINSDDYQTKPWIVVRSFEEFKASIIGLSGYPELISFDHDLGPGPSGYDCAKWLIYRSLYGGSDKPWNGVAWVHSKNPVGAGNIRGIIDSYGKIKNLHEVQ